jgi:1,4-dihydroxy-6-naphthoate synthase
MLPTGPAPITFYYSADSDDAFMYWALRKKIIDTAPFILTIKTGNTEDLNRAALSGEPDICALSIYAYGLIADRYVLFPHSGSVGRNYGPVIVAKKPYTVDDLPNLTVATPGENTTAHCLLKLISPQTKTKVIPIVPFERVLEAIDHGEVDAGLLIHEGLLLYSQLGLHLVCDVGKWWFEKTALPLPLGGTVIKKALGSEAISFLSFCLRSSIKYSLEHPDEVLQNIIQEDKRMTESLHDQNLIRRYLALYANEDTLDYGEDGRKAIQTFLSMSHEAGLLPKRVRVEFTP